MKHPALFRAAMYLRISKEDPSSYGAMNGQSNSILNQRLLILDFLKEKDDIALVNEYIDDGYSGTSFQRPGFLTMLDEVKKGTINCVIVKDLSRFGRNYIETGRYLEKIFPMLGVRFVSVNDNIDTQWGYSSAVNLVLPFQNLLNDAYSKDISTKVKSHLEVKRKRGEYIGAFAVYGYKKSKENNNQLMVDGYASKVVKDIYFLKLCGYSHQRIAEWLNGGGILSPYEYKKSIGSSYETGFQKGESSKWNAASVLRILKNEVYTGTLVQGRQSVINYKTKERQQKDESLWIRVKNAHAPIISPILFNAVSKLLKRDIRVSPQEDIVYPLAGLVYCGACKKSMVRKQIKVGGKYYTYYICSSYKMDRSCNSHRISEQILLDCVKQVLVPFKIDTERWKRNLQNINSYIEENEKEKIRLEKIKRNLYKDYKNNNVTKEEYLEYMDRLTKKINEQNDGKKNLMVKKVRDQDMNFKNDTMMLRVIAAVLIDHIYVHNDKELELFFQIRDPFQAEVV